MFSFFTKTTPVAPNNSSDMPSSLSSKRIDWAGLGWLYLFFWYFSGVMQTLLISSNGIEGFRCAFYMSFMWLAPVLLFPRYTKQICAIIGIILYATSVASLSYWSIYGSEFSQSTLFIVFETTAQESQEYISQYITFPLILGIILYTVTAYFLWRRTRPVYLPRPYAACAAFIVLFLNLSEPYFKYFTGKNDLTGATNKLLRRMEPAAPWQFLMSYFQYKIQLNTVDTFLKNNASMPPFGNLADRNGDTPRTIVLVIGESTTRQRMSLYGYSRKTTPRLDALKEKGELLAFTDVITPRPYTFEVLKLALSFASQEEEGRYLTEPNIMNLMNQAGYKTFWITNQQVLREGNALQTSFSQQASVAKYLNNNRLQNASVPDQVVFAPFAEMLLDPAPKKFIVLHLLGTHSKYSLRYPKEYDVFTGRDHVPENLSDSQTERFNSYDNAVLYNDFVVSSLIDIFSKNKQNGFLLYFSDHGEEVFNDPKHEILGRNEDYPTLDMYAVPFMLWMSPEWKKTYPLNFDSMTDRPYSNEHLIHTLSDLAGLSYDRFLPERSLVNSSFKPHTRWIGNSKNKNGLRDFDATVVTKPLP